MFDWEMYPAVPYNASSIYGIIKMKWDEIKYSVRGTTVLKFVGRVILHGSKEIGPVIVSEE